MSHYNMTNIENYSILVTGFSIYGLSLILYGKYLVPFVVSLPVIPELVTATTASNLDINHFVTLFNENANRLILQNNRELLLIAQKVMDSFLSSSNITNVVNISQLADQYGHQVFLAIKSDPVLYSKLMHNDVLVNYIADVIKQGSLNKNIPEALGLKL
jgi:hypothetical protein